MKETRNWLELPIEMTLQIFLKLSAFDLLLNVQSVCSSWREIARDPSLYRHINMSYPWDYFGKTKSPSAEKIDMGCLSNHISESEFAAAEKMAMEAIRRSCGKLANFSITYFGSNKILQHIAETSFELKSLRLAYCYTKVSQEELLDAVTAMPLLEEVEFFLCGFDIGTVEVLGGACPEMKSFRLIHDFPLYVYPPPPEYQEVFDDEALGIANYMTGLRSLHLVGNMITNNGLLAILEKCLHLEDLYVLRCLNVKLEGELARKYYRIQKSRFSEDLTEVYGQQYDKRY